MKYQKALAVMTLLRQGRVTLDNVTGDELNDAVLLASWMERDPKHPAHGQLDYCEIVRRLRNPDPLISGMVSADELAALQTLPEKERRVVDEIAFHERALLRDARLRELKTEIENFAALQREGEAMLTNPERDALRLIAASDGQSPTEILGNNVGTWTTARERLGPDTVALVVSNTKTMLGILKEQIALEKEASNDVLPGPFAEAQTRLAKAKESASQSAKAYELRQKIQAREAEAAKAKSEAEELKTLENDLARERAEGAIQRLADMGQA